MISRRSAPVSALSALLWIGMGAAACESPGERQPLQGELVQGTLESMAGDSILRLSGGDTLRLSALTLDFYFQRGGQAAWVSNRGLLRRGTALHEAVGRALEDGLPPERYRHDVATRLLAEISDAGRGRISDSLGLRQLAELDILLTEGFNRFAQDLVLGMMDPLEAGLDWRIAAEAPPPSTLLNTVVAGQTPADVVEALRPTMPQYAALRRALADFREVATQGGWDPVAADSTLQEGIRSPAVTQLRERLIQGVDSEEAVLARAGLGDPSLLDGSLLQAIQRFQTRHAIEPSGRLGASTFEALNRTAEDWIAEVQLNLDRWRWLPRALGERYVLVNISGFEMEVVEGGRVLETMRVVVGAEATSTPIFSDSIRYVVVNPYWNIPDGIMRRTIAPAMARNPNYLRENNMEMVDGRVRQRPGPRNALGRYKFIFPNEFDVYLHDTPDGHLFSETERAFSSGCVRIERPADFARMLLRLQSSQDPESLEVLLAEGGEQWIALDQPLPIFLLYLTAWSYPDGSVHFYSDIYGRDEAMKEQAEDLLPPESLLHSLNVP
jgi:L,D-transpeptidase YcbB